MFQLNRGERHWKHSLLSMQPIITSMACVQFLARAGMIAFLLLLALKTISFSLKTIGILDNFLICFISRFQGF